MFSELSETGHALVATMAKARVRRVAMALVRVEAEDKTNLKLLRGPPTLEGGLVR